MCSLIHPLPVKSSRHHPQPTPSTPGHSGSADSHYQELYLLLGSNGKCGFAQGLGIKRNQFERVNLSNEPGTRWKNDTLLKFQSAEEGRAA